MNATVLNYQCANRWHFPALLAFLESCASFCKAKAKAKQVQHEQQNRRPNFTLVSLLPRFPVSR